MEFNDSLSIGMDDFSNNEEMEIPEVLPMMAVRDVVVFNYMIIPLFVGRPGSVEAVNEALGTNKLLMLVTQKDATKDNPKVEDLYEVGMVCVVMRTLKLPDGRLKVLVQAMSKARIKEFVRTEPSYQVSVEVIEDVEAEEVTVEVEALMRAVREQTEKIMSLRGILSADLMMIINNIEDPGRLADLVGSNLRLKISESQKILEESDPVERLRLVSQLLTKELEVSTVQAKIQNDAKEEMSKSQREYFLREQMHALQKELGDTDERSQEIDELERKIKKTKMPKSIRKEAKKQLSRMDMMHPDSSEATIIRTYIDWILDIPWKKSTKDMLDLVQAKIILDEDHHGLDKVKERILEYLAVRKLNQTTKGPILCFVGPPGVGKTSLGKSVARAMGRKFHRISLGGMRDEAEIRGHRRTYIGAMPGRIVQGLKTVATNNPVFMMDEIDKLGSDYRGDPSSALLEVLDPEQNFEFSDHYMNLPIDLSKVMFITTANMSDTIPGPLLDRMEVIRLSGYTQEEKVVIARRYLLPRQIKQNGLKARQVRIDDETLQYIVTHYTYEAGLRNLEREIGKVCRKIARKVAEGGKGPYTVSNRNLDRYLGPPKNIPESELEKLEQPGLVTGLAWTEVGGEILQIEVNIMPGKGKLLMTGQLGDVMKESAQAALTYCRSRSEELKVAEDYFDKIDLHIHVPAGAIPKDGPSAGITMATALYSAITGRTVISNLAMTGEVTLRGRVLPIGGLKEKALAALRADITTVIIPAQNEKDLQEIPIDIRNKMEFFPVKDMDEVVKIAFPKVSAVKTAKATAKLSGSSDVA
ncbi:endopeptidase La [Desulfopila sp. IMCC35006]|uniref:endopeptidase La n=1 Tax=Desulfopila sp. IMCC35006 TaxID=2569542 RepID=UPI0010ABDC64|nr:endopeptidase La [Desulfopila sp. IMCC35006]TKB26609.1 endopeptidase La [Desulfopila sp. IMCC35006]